MSDAMHAGERATSSDPVTLQIVRGALRAIQSEMEARDRAHGHVAVHPREEGLLCRPVRRRRPADRRLQPAGVRRRGRPRSLEHYPLPDHAARRHLLVQRLLRLQGGRLAFARPGVRRPVFAEGKLAAFAQSWAHFNDIGGMRAGSLSPDCTEIFQEGIIVPPVRVAREGVIVEELLRLFYRNSRFPEMVKGDTRASMAAIRLGERRLGELFARFGRARTTDAFERLIAETERELRAEAARAGAARAATPSPTPSTATARATAPSSCAIASTSRPTASCSTPARATTRCRGRSTS